MASESTVGPSGIRLPTRTDRVVTVAATQFRVGPSLEANAAKAEALVRQAARGGAQVILLQELFQAPYFCKDQREDLFDLAAPALPSENPFLQRFSRLAAELSVVLPISFFEAAGKAHFNSIVVFDADGSVAGLYRKSHIPTGPGYQEKFYFNPGDTGFRVFKTKYATIGVAICWDQWFPEAARCMALLGADVLFYPTAIGSEPQDPTLDSKDHWQRVMQGHSAANLIPVVASNRIGTEAGAECELTFYGHSFVTDHTGAMLRQAGRDEEQVLTATFNLDDIRRARASWGLFRDRRPDLYGVLLTLDGATPAGGDPLRPRSKL